MKQIADVLLRHVHKSADKEWLRHLRGGTGHPDKGMSKNEELSPANKDYITFESITLIRVIKPEIFTYLYFRGQ